MACSSSSLYALRDGLSLFRVEGERDGGDRGYGSEQRRLFLMMRAVAPGAQDFDDCLLPSPAAEACTPAGLTALDTASITAQVRAL